MIFLFENLSTCEYETELGQPQTQSLKTAWIASSKTSGCRYQMEGNVGKNHFAVVCGQPSRYLGTSQTPAQ
jgi:hypothetical protein